MEKHYAKRHQARHRRNAEVVSALMQDFTKVLHFSEDGDELNTVYAASLQTGTMKFAKPYVRMYVMQIARFLGNLLSELGYACYGSKINEVPHLPEFFAIFNNSDRYFFGRKTWSIYRP